MIRKILTVTVLLFAVGIIGMIVVQANSVDGEKFSTEEDGNSILEASEGQEQVRELRFQEIKEARLLAEKEAEEERKRQEDIKKEAEEERKRQEDIKKEVEEDIKKEAEEVINKEPEETVNKEPDANVESKQKEGKADNEKSAPKEEPKHSGTDLGTFEATAYGPDCVGCSGVTANGTDIRNGNIYVSGYRVIAADTSVIPMNSIVKITYNTGKTEMAKVCDVGGAIKGKIIDIAFASEAETPAFGRQQVQIELIK